jgi:L-histidine Nalpha-methyltransferase
LTHNAQRLAEHFSSHRGQAVSLGTNKSGAFNLVELGAGDGRKTKVLLRAMLDAGQDFDYIPVDISRRAMNELFDAMAVEFSELECDLRVHGVIGDYIQAMEHIRAEWPNRRTIVLFLGSTIGNFDSEGAVSFLKSLQQSLMPCDLLLAGFDMEKDVRLMKAAYSDVHGVTSEFNLNLLVRLNRELSATFDVAQFEHKAVYNSESCAMESYLVSRTKQRVDVGNGVLVEFSRGESILTECSHKYTACKINVMAKTAGFKHVTTFCDDSDWFVDMLAEVVKKTEQVDNNTTV